MEDCNPLRINIRKPFDDHYNSILKTQQGAMESDLACPVEVFIDNFL